MGAPLMDLTPIPFLHHAHSHAWLHPHSGGLQVLSTPERLVHCLEQPLIQSPRHICYCVSITIPISIISEARLEVLILDRISSRRLLPARRDSPGLVATCSRSYQFSCKDTLLGKLRQVLIRNHNDWQEKVLGFRAANMIFRRRTNSHRPFSPIIIPFKSSLSNARAVVYTHRSLRRSYSLARSSCLQ